MNNIEYYHFMLNTINGSCNGSYSILYTAPQHILYGPKEEEIPMAIPNTSISTISILSEDSYNENIGIGIWKFKMVDSKSNFYTSASVLDLSIWIYGWQLSLSNGDWIVKEEAEYNIALLPTITSLKFNEGWESIYFEQSSDFMSNLESIELPQSLKYLYRLPSSKKLKHITIPQNVILLGFSFGSLGSDSETVISGSFWGQNSLTSILWNAKNATTFYGANGLPLSLTSINFGPQVEHIPSYLCYNLRLLKTIYIPKNVKSIGLNAFRGCLFAKKNFINASTLLFGEEEAYNYWGATVADEEIDGLLIKDSKIIEFREPADENSIITINIPLGVTHIEDLVFEHCYSLTSITIPNSVTSIGRWCFGSCDSLTSVTIPNSVKYIGHCAFGNCRSLTSINYEGTIEEWSSIIVNGSLTNEETPATYIQCADGQTTHRFK